MKKYILIIILGLIAIINAIYLSYKAYYFMYVDTSGITTFCDINTLFGCGNVLQHPLSRVFGIPFPWIALLVYPVIVSLAVWGYKKKDLLAARIIQVLSLGGMLFNFFIIYREIMYIHSYCVLCMMCTAIIITIFIITTLMLRTQSTVEGPQQA